LYRHATGSGLPPEGPLSTDPRVDACVASAAAFAQPILREIRRLHAASPEAGETLKWRMPAFCTAAGRCAAWPRSRRMPR